VPRVHLLPYINKGTVKEGSVIYRPSFLKVWGNHLDSPSIQDISTHYSQHTYHYNNEASYTKLTSYPTSKLTRKLCRYSLPFYIMEWIWFILKIEEGHTHYKRVVHSCDHTTKLLIVHLAILKQKAIHERKKGNCHWLQGGTLKGDESLRGITVLQLTS
jgi:hypothetical protein